jgi:hypothetical protein
MTNGIVKSAAKATIEGFVGLQSSEARRDAYVDFSATLLAFVISVVLIAFLGRYLWDNVVVDLFSFARPSRSIWQILGLMVFVALLS